MRRLLLSLFALVFLGATSVLADQTYDPKPWLDDLAQITAPVQLIWGTEDRLAYPSVQSRADSCREVRADIGIELVPDGGHWIQYEQAAAVNRLLMEFHGA